MDEPHVHTAPKQGVSAHLCERCNRDLAYSNEVLSDRMSLWTSASNLLLNREFSGDGNDVTPDDVMTLTLFLAGENG